MSTVLLPPVEGFDNFWVAQGFQKPDASGSSLAAEQGVAPEGPMNTENPQDDTLAIEYVDPIGSIDRWRAYGQKYHLPRPGEDLMKYTRLPFRHRIFGAMAVFYGISSQEPKAK